MVILILFIYISVYQVFSYCLIHLLGHLLFLLCMEVIQKRSKAYGLMLIYY